MTVDVGEGFPHQAATITALTDIVALMAGDTERGDKCKFLTYLAQSASGGNIDLHAVTMETIISEHPDFNTVYEMLYREFGPRGEIEAREILRTRSEWDPLRSTPDKPPLEYRLMILKLPRQAGRDSSNFADPRSNAFYSVDGREIIGVRDHNIIFQDGIVVVHLSHSLLVERARGTGLDTVLRTIPVVDAKIFAKRLGCPDAPIILYAEQEPVPILDEIQNAAFLHYEKGIANEIDSINMRFRRLAAYQGGLFKKLGVNHVCAQPDFSTAEQITAKGGPQLVALNGIWRFVGREEIAMISGRLLRSVVSAVYDMYEASGLDQRAIAQARQSLSGYPEDDEQVKLILPLETIV